MAFTLRPYRRLSKQCAVGYIAGLFVGQGTACER